MNGRPFLRIEAHPIARENVATRLGHRRQHRRIELQLQPVTQTAQSLRRLCEWLELEFALAMLAPVAQSGSHILSGNRVRFDAEKGAAIHYDAAWMTHGAGIAQLALAWPPLAALNRRLVYSASRQ